jgi:hypothetical protein
MEYRKGIHSTAMVTNTRTLRNYNDNLRALSELLDGGADKYDFLLHTPLGVLTVVKTFMVPTCDFVFIDTVNAKGQYSLLALTESLLVSMVLEVVSHNDKEKKNRNSIGFKVESPSEVTTGLDKS